MLVEPKNKNYCATVVKIETLIDLPNCNNVQAAIILNNQVIVGKDTKVGDIGLFFPVETQLDTEFLKHNNLHREPELNIDPEKKGYFEAHGRVKCVKFRGHKSEGFFVPISFMDYLREGDSTFNLVLGQEFDEIEGIEICRKYVPKGNPSPLAKNTNRQRKQRPEDSIVEGQFRQHIDTANLRKNIDRIGPNDIISITDKWHGTSGIVANLLVKKKLKWFSRLLRYLGVDILDTEYGIIHSSRRVVKGVGDAEKTGVHFYGTNIWGVVAKEIQDRIPKCYTLYFEVVGYTPDGSEIQKGYTYGCQVGTHKVLVYRITVTNPDGFVLELDYNQRIDFCKKYGFEPVKPIYYGTVSDFIAANLEDHYDGPPVSPENYIETVFLAILEKMYMSRTCEYNPGKPAEGIVVRIEKFDDCDSYKLKSFAFLERESKELDSGEIDLETAESEEVNNV